MRGNSNKKARDTARAWHFVVCFSTRSEVFCPYPHAGQRGIIRPTQLDEANMRMALVLAALLVVAGCAATPAELAAEDDATCTGYGFTPRTTDYAACRLQVAQSRENRDATKRAAWMAGYMASRKAPGQ
jgi:hypothetical protein